MRFEREINIYSDEAVLKRFRAVETSVSVVQGKISAMISESELTELENSNATMYSKLASAIMEIDALTINFSDLTTKYNTVSGQYSELNSKVATYKASVDELSVDISSVQQNLSKNYSTTTQMNSAINAKANEITTSVSSIYARRSELNIANGKINDLEIWKNEASIKITDSSIISTVTSSSTYKNSVNSLIEQKADSIRLKANSISWQSTYSSMTSSGTLTCRNATVEGTIHSDNGDDEIYMRSARLDFIRDGVNVGTIGTNVNSDNNAQKGLVFDLEYTGHYMAWAVRESASASKYTMKWTYSRAALTGAMGYTANSLNAGCDIDMHYYYLRNVNWPDGGITGTMNFVQIAQMNSNGTVQRWYNGCKMQFKNGILISATFN